MSQCDGSGPMREKFSPASGIRVAGTDDRDRRPIDRKFGSLYILPKSAERSPRCSADSRCRQSRSAAWKPRKQGGTCRGRKSLGRNRIACRLPNGASSPWHRNQLPSATPRKVRICAAPLPSPTRVRSPNPASADIADHNVRKRESPPSFAVSRSGCGMGTRTPVTPYFSTWTRSCCHG
jgi:hypothetical protein